MGEVWVLPTEFAIVALAAAVVATLWREARRGTQRPREQLTRD